MTQPVCRVCTARDPSILFQRSAAFTVTSAQVPTSVETIDVRLCPECSHVQSQLIDDLPRYYDSDYNFHLGDDDKDDLYSTETGTPVYRAEHQLATLLSAYEYEQPMRVLDYGCGKAPTLRALSRQTGTVSPLVFDVSAAYKPFWDEFVPAAQQAVHDIPQGWAASCDLIVSFFALEHVADPRYFAADVFGLLRPGGRLHLLVPNMYDNINDILVVDHVNHFSPSSLHRLFYEAGFDEISVDTSTHKAALTLTAKRPESGAQPCPAALPEVAPYVSAAREISVQCTQMFANIESHVAKVQDRPVVIYGSGIYAMMILASFRDRTQVRAFLDNNTYRQGGQLFGIPIMPPQQIPDEAECVIVGLNPRFARQIIASMPFLVHPGRAFFYL